MSAIPRESREYTAPALFDRPLDISRVNLDVVAFVLLIGLSIVTHLWALGHMALHHDESIHAWMTWRLYTGAGTFNCAGGRVAATYCYDPVYHGPSLYLLTALSYFLFGDGNAQARLPQAVAGILLVASCWMLRPYFGRRGALIAGALLAFAPSLLYFTRFARHDGLMILWTFWMVIGFFRYLDTGRPGYLYLLAAGTGLAMATHELYYILFFLFGSFVLIRALAELLPLRRLTIGMGVLLALTIAIMIWNPPLTPRLRAGGLALLFGTVVGVGLLIARVWDNAPILTTRARMLWQAERNVLWTAIGILATIFVLLYSVFFTDPRGIADGLYQGLSYWLGSQHEYARGKQPWYYYLMQLPVYEPIALFGSIGAAAYLFALRRPRALALVGLIFMATVLFVANLTGVVGILLGCAALGLAIYLFITGWWRGPQTGSGKASADPAEDDGPTKRVTLEKLEFETDGLDGEAAAEPARQAQPSATGAPLFPLFLAFWFIGSLVAFSWAGEKMPWLVTHISLPGNLLAAWALGRLLDSVEWRTVTDRRLALVPPALVLVFVVFGVALWRILSAGEGQAGQASMLLAIIPLLVGGLLIFGILTIGQQASARATLALCGLTIAGMLGIYMIRSTWLLVYDHPDTPKELLIYVQSTPDVPLIVEDIRTLAINQTRNNRSAADPTGGRSMPVIMDTGDASGEGSLAWPYYWYLRDFQRIEGRNADFFRNANADSFQVAVDPKQPEGDKAFAPVVMVYVPHMTEATRQALEENYVAKYNSKLNWYFPEGDLTGCDPRVPGYKRFYYNWSTLAQAKADKQCAHLDVYSLPYESPFAPLIWPLQREHWRDMWRYLIYRELPETLQIHGREIQVWVRKDLAASGGAQSDTATSGLVKLVAQDVLGAPGTEAGQLDQPRGLAVDSQGNVYVSDIGTHRIQVFGPDGTPVRTIGAFGSDAGQLNEPRGVAVDSQGNLYVADTWNGQIDKFDPNGTFLKSWGEGKDIGNGRRASMTDGTAAGNAAVPLGFYGPRGIAVDSQGHVYIADTGNKRIVVTDSEGTFLYQWGHAGSEPGAFNEPTGIAVDGQGNVYVADTWNGRVQVFGRGQDGKVDPVPQVFWRVSGWQPNTYDDPTVAASPSGQVFASVPGRNLMLYANMRGDVLLRWGGKGSDTASLVQPSGTAVGPDGTVYVVDRGNGRVLRFKLPAEGR